MHFVLAAILAAGAPVPSNQQAVSFVSRDGNVVNGTISWPAGSADRSLAFVLIGEPDTAPETAAALNAAGLTVLRYDARGIGAPSDADDAIAAVAAAGQDPHADPTRVYLLARGAGAVTAMRAALDGAGVAGIVLASPLLSRGASYEASLEVSKLTVPVLLLHGSADTQVTTEEIKEFAAAAHAAQRSLQIGELAGDNHLLQAVPPAIDPRAVAAIVAWLAEPQ
jgi:alpha-beta hydrolase superfamily lysophospholipase